MVPSAFFQDSWFTEVRVGCGERDITASLNTSFEQQEKAVSAASRLITALGLIFWPQGDEDGPLRTPGALGCPPDALAGGRGEPQHVAGAQLCLEREGARTVPVKTL